MAANDTIYALSTGRPPAAISVIRLSGPRAHQVASKIAGKLPNARHAAFRRFLDPVSGELLDEGILLRFDAPASSTGENLVELHCHGGRAVIDALVLALQRTLEVREALPGEFTRRAFENGRIDLTEAEGLADLIEAETQSQRKAAIGSARGGLRRRVEEWRDEVVSLAAAAERAIDYDEDDHPFDPALTARCHRVVGELDRWLKMPRVEPLKDGIRVVVAGPPNAGKSSLINAIAGDDKAIVTPIPGTTRDAIDVPLSLGGIPIRLTDTAGLRTTCDEVEAIGIARAQALVGLCDVLIWLGEPDQVPEHPCAIIVQAKADLGPGAAAQEGLLQVSSVEMTGIGELLERIEAAARAILPREGELALNRRQADHIHELRDALCLAVEADNTLFFAEHLRQGRSAIDRLTGRSGVEDLLDVLFSRFCLGK